MKQAEILRGFVAASALSRAAIAELLGVSESTLSRVLAGTRKLGSQKAAEVARHIGVAEEKILDFVLNK